MTTTYGGYTQNGDYTHNGQPILGVRGTSICGLTCPLTACAPYSDRTSLKNNGDTQHFGVSVVAQDILAWPLLYRQGRSSELRGSEPAREARKRHPPPQPRQASTRLLLADYLKENENVIAIAPHPKRSPNIYPDARATSQNIRSGRGSHRFEPQ